MESDIFSIVNTGYDPVVAANVFTTDSAYGTKNNEYSGIVDSYGKIAIPIGLESDYIAISAPGYQTSYLWYESLFDRDYEIVLYKASDLAYSGGFNFNFFGDDSAAADNSQGETSGDITHHYDEDNTEGNISMDPAQSGETSSSNNTGLIILASFGALLLARRRRAKK